MGIFPETREIRKGISAVDSTRILHMIESLLSQVSDESEVCARGDIGTPIVTRWFAERAGLVGRRACYS